MIRSVAANRLALPILLLIGVFLSERAPAGDETDYSAPYLTVENGELVTKYPAKKHLNVQTTGDSAATSTTGPVASELWPFGWQGVAIVGLLAGTLILVISKRKATRKGVSAPRR